MKIYTVYGERIRLHPECKESFRCDRQHRLIYPPYLVDGKLMGVGQASIEAEFCGYCGEEN